MTRGQRVLLAAAVLVALATVLPLTVLVRDGWPPLRTIDTDLEHALVLPHGLLRDAVLAVTQLGAPLLLELVTVVAMVVLWRRGRVRLALYAGISVLGAELVSAVSKSLVGRSRPCLDMPGCPRTTSFPSGHAVGSAAFWTTAAVLLLPVVGRRAWLLLVVPPVVALTRVLLGVHYPSDVAVGLLVGGCWAAGWTAVFATWHDQVTGRDVPLEQGVG